MSEITLGGRRYKVIDFDRRTVTNDHYLMRTMRLTGADKVLPAADEMSDVYLARLQTTLIDSGYAADLLGGYLLPIDKSEQDWTVEMARETARHIGLCNTQQDRDQVAVLAAEVAFGFFRQGLALLKSFQNSLTEAGPKLDHAETTPAA